MMPSVSDLKYFVEVCNTLNISRAAERLGISQPSLTLALQRLESSLGIRVFVRTKRGVSMTPAGSRLLSYSRSLMQTWEDVKTHVLASETEVEGTYSIGCHPSVALYSLAGFLPDLMKKFPKLEIHLKHDLSRRIAEAVVSSQLDLGIVINPVRHPDLVITKLGEDQVTLWMQGDMNLSEANPKHHVLLCDPDLMQVQSLLRNLKKGSLHFNRVVKSSSLEVLATLTAHGCGIGILPGRVASLIQDKPLRKVPNAPVFNDEICLIFRSENRNVKSMQTISEAIRKSFKTPRK